MPPSAALGHPILGTSQHALLTAPMEVPDFVPEAKVAPLESHVAPTESKAFGSIAPWSAVGGVESLGRVWDEAYLKILQQG